MKPEIKKKKEWAAFIGDIADVMNKHNVTDLVAIFGMNDELRNTYIPLKEEKDIYCNISDAFDEWLKQGIVKANMKALMH